MSTLNNRKPLTPGTLINGYRIINLLGAGSFGLTYSVSHNQSAILVLKEFFPDGVVYRDKNNKLKCFEGDEATRIFNLGSELFVSEAKNIASISHPNIMEVREFFFLNNTNYLVSAFTDGQSLDKILKTGNQFREWQLNKVCLGIIQGLGFCHDVKIIHCDLKPSNIIIKNDFSPVIIDFGASVRLRNGSTGNSEMYTEGYSAPERLSSNSLIGSASDVYSIGAVFFKLIAGRNIELARHRLLKDDQKEIRSALANASSPACQWLRLFTENALYIDPKERPQLDRKFLLLAQKELQLSLVHRVEPSEQKNSKRLPFQSPPITQKSERSGFEKSILLIITGFILLGLALIP